MSFCKGASWGRGTTIVFTASKISNGACWESSNGKSDWIEDRSLIVSDEVFDFTFTAAEMSEYRLLNGGGIYFYLPYDSRRMCSGIEINII